MQEYLDKLRERYLDEPVKWATLGGLLLLIISPFLDWWTADLGAFGEVSENGFDENGIFTFIIALVGVAAIGAYVYANVNIQQQALLWGLVVGAIVIDILLLIDFLDIITEDVIGVGIGLWLAIVGAIALSVGAIVPMWSEIRERAEGMRSGGGTAN